MNVNRNVLFFYCYIFNTINIYGQILEQFKVFGFMKCKADNNDDIYMYTINSFMNNKGNPTLHICQRKDIKLKK